MSAFPFGKPITIKEFLDRLEKDYGVTVNKTRAHFASEGFEPHSITNDEGDVCYWILLDRDFEGTTYDAQLVNVADSDNVRPPTLEATCMALRINPADFGGFDIADLEPPSGDDDADPADYWKND